MEPAILSPLQYEELKRSVIEKMAVRNKIVPLNSLMHPSYQLTTPLHISIEFDDDGTVIAGLNEVEAFAYAQTEYEAVELLCEEIVQLYEDLISDAPSNLGPIPRKWLDYLQGVIRCR